jgi:hypothetical protein
MWERKMNKANQDGHETTIRFLRTLPNAIQRPTTKTEDISDIVDHAAERHCTPGEVTAYLRMLR